MLGWAGTRVPPPWTGPRRVVVITRRWESARVGNPAPVFTWKWTPSSRRATLPRVDEQQQRLERLRARRQALTAAATSDPEATREAAELDREIAEAEGQSLLGSGAPRTDTRLAGSSARCYVAAMMKQGPHGVHARRLYTDARTGSVRALNRLRLAARVIRHAIVHASVSGAPRRPGRVGRPRRGPARAAPARPRHAGAA